MRRRDFIKVIVGSAAAWPLAARAQQSERTRRIGILMPLRENDPQTQLRIGAFSQVLRQIGWVEGRTIVFANRFSDGDPERLPELALDLVRANVDVIITQAAEPVEALHRATTSIPIVMASVGDAVGAGYVDSLAHPGATLPG
jgi:putative ABC transport system substrate-binding protein